jgi:hypothetical protein
MTVYEFAKDFAGPISTVIAAVAALTVTAYFNHRQSTIASAQLQLTNSRPSFLKSGMKSISLPNRFCDVP